MDAGRVRARAIGGAGPAARFAALAVSAALLLLAAGTPRADAQTIVNTATVNGQGNWLTSLTTTGNDGIRPEGRHIRLSLLVEHPPGRIVTGLKIDQDWDSSDESASSPTITAGLDVQQPNVAGGFNYSRVNYDFLTTTDAIPAGEGVAFSTLHVRAVLDNGSVSDPVSSALSFLSAVNVFDADQNPFLFRWSRVAAPSFFGGTTPGSQISFGAVGQDPDPAYCVFHIPPKCFPEALGGSVWRTRNQLTGATTAGTRRCRGDYLRNDDDGRGISAPAVFPGRGTFAVDAALLNEEIPPPYSNDLTCESQSGGLWWPLGSIDVNSSSLPPPILGLGARPVVGGKVDVIAVVPTDPDAADGGRVQYIEWDLDGNPSNGTNGFDRATLGTYDEGLAPDTFWHEPIDTDGMTPGLKTVRIRVTDNGAMSGADNARATSTVATGQYLVDSPPVISPVSVVHSAINAPVSIPLDAEDADGDPITWSVTDGPDHGSGSLTDASGTSNNYDFLPDEGYAGTDNVTFEVADGWGGTSTRTVGLSFHPETSIDVASPEALTQETDASFEFSSDTLGVIFLCTLTGPGGQQFGPCTSPAVYSSLPDGEHRFRVVAVIGPVGDGTPPIHEWTIDTTAPETAIRSQPDPRIVKSSRRAKVRFAFGADENASFECKLDQKSFADCRSPVTYRVKPGPHGFSVRATDEAGNLGPAEQTSFRFKRKG